MKGHAFGSALPYSWQNLRMTSRIHKAQILRLSEDLPILVEIVDTKEKIEHFLPLIDEAIQDGLVTLENVEIRFYRSGS